MKRVLISCIVLVGALVLTGFKHPAPTNYQRPRASFAGWPQ